MGKRKVEFHILACCYEYSIPYNDEYVRIIRKMLVKRNCTNTVSCLATLFWSHMFKLFFTFAGTCT